MIDIPASFIISSRLSVLDSKDILRVIHLAQQKWNESQVKSRMQHHSTTPLLAVGISNPQELSTVIANDIPIIHIESDCKALQAVQKREIQHQRHKSRVYMTLLSSLWGCLLYQLKYNGLFRLKRGADVVDVRVFERGSLPLPNVMIAGISLGLTACLAWITKRRLHKKRMQYDCIDGGDDGFVLLRNDVSFSRFSFIAADVIPYCIIGLAAFSYKRIKM
ncbi:hypothetical protein V8B55DRAFT_1518994 [Mucor lusitanicus]|uniref:Uncharacterized protein n=2 Tax=Mucor circinelloides f. lusitanicus TaxID=29924 RepID=A0A168LA84_MUCCL|nr:hypothetical protein FB192DRAFT_1395255 [Mucor lusitanicus]OAD03285.1 hypothetical protein MUCCIDRAFT_162864 [Mucor lusitanicus CBS 277.49]